MANPPTEVAALRKRLRAYSGAYPHVAQVCGVSYHWLTQFVRGAQDNPTARTLERLRAGLAKLGPARHVLAQRKRRA